VSAVTTESGDLNVAINAVQAIGSVHGKITIRTGIEGGDSDHDWIEIAGAGIPKENLSLSYGAGQKHQGRIGVHSEVGPGTVFRIVVPIWQRTLDGQP